MAASTATLEDLYESEAQLGRANVPSWALLALALLALLGLLTGKPAIGVVGLMGCWIAGPVAISRTAQAIKMSPLLKYPLFLCCAVPGLSLLPALYLLWFRRQAGDTLRQAIQSREAAERRQARRSEAGGAPAAAQAAAAAAAAPRAGPEQALPIIRVIADSLGREGATLEMRVREGQLPAEAQGAKLPPLRVSGLFAVGYHVDAGSHWVSVGEDEWKAAGLTLDTLHRRALGNLMGLVKGKPGLRVVEGEPYSGLLLDGDHESCLVLLDGVWDTLLRERTPNGAVVALPFRDVLMFCDARSAAGIAAIRQKLREAAGQPKFVSGALLRREGGRWVLMP